MITHIRRRANTNAMLYAVSAQISTPRPSGRHDMNLKIVGTQAHTFGTEKTHAANIGAVQIVFGNGITMHLIDLILGKRHRHIHDVRGTEQAIGMVLHSKNRGAFFSVISSYTFKHAQAIMQGMRQYMDFRFTPINPCAIQPNYAVSIVHCHHLFSNISEYLICSSWLKYFFYRLIP